MAAKLVTDAESWIGTNAERLAMSTVGLPVGSTFWETDTRTAYIWDGSAWSQV